MQWPGRIVRVDGRRLESEASLLMQLPSRLSKTWRWASSGHFRDRGSSEIRDVPIAVSSRLIGNLSFRRWGGFRAGIFRLSSLKVKAGRDGTGRDGGVGWRVVWSATLRGKRGFPGLRKVYMGRLYEKGGDTLFPLSQSVKGGGCRREGMGPRPLEDCRGYERLLSISRVGTYVRIHRRKRQKKEEGERKKHERRASTERDKDRLTR